MCPAPCWLSCFFWPSIFLSGRFGGGSLLQGVPSIRKGQKMKKMSFAAPKAPQMFFQYFLEKFGKFLDKNSIKNNFWGVLGRNISKISKKFPYLREKYLYQRPKILTYIYTGAETPPKNLPNLYALSLYLPFILSDLQNSFHVPYICCTFYHLYHFSTSSTNT